MRFDKFTIKAQETIQSAKDAAEKRRNQYIEPEHLIFAGLNEEGSITASLLQKAGASAAQVTEELSAAIDNKTASSWKYPKALLHFLQNWVMIRFTVPDH